MIRFTAVFLMVIVLVGLVSAQATKPETVKLAISGMSCNSCVTKVDKALRDVKGMKDVKVDLKSESAEVVLASASVKPDALVKAVVIAGFKAQVGKKTAARRKKRKNRAAPVKSRRKREHAMGIVSRKPKTRRRRPERAEAGQPVAD